MGRKVSIDLDLDSLPPDQAETLRGLLDQTNFFSLTDSAKPPVPDEFNYTIQVATQLMEHTVHTTDSSMDASLQALVNELSQQAKSRG